MTRRRIGALALGVGLVVVAVYAVGLQPTPEPSCEVRAAQRQQASTTDLTTVITSREVGVAPENLASEVAAGSPEEIFWVRPGTATNVSIVLKAGQQVRGLDPNNPPLFLGPNDPTNPLRFARGAGGSAPGVVLADLKVAGYHPADPSWREVRGNVAPYQRQPTIAGDSLPNAHLLRLELYNNGLAIRLGDGMVIKDVYLHHNHQFGLKGNNDTNWKVLGGEWAFNNVHPNGGGYYDHDVGAANKFVGATDGLIEDLWTHDNEGPGWWFDSGSNAVTVRRVRSESNAGAGGFWELNDGWVIVEDSEFFCNGGAANLVIANSSGDSANPIILRRNVTGGHIAGREIRLVGNGTRTPRLGYVSVLDNQTPSIAVALTNGHPQPDGILVAGNSTPDGTPAGLK